MSLVLGLQALRAGIVEPMDAPGNEGLPVSGWLVRTWQTDEGLPDNNITGVAQTADGYLWVASLGGLTRFDGARFEEFSTTHFPKVPNRNVRALYLDRQQRLWLALDRGALIRVGETNTHVFDTADGFSSSRVTVVAEDNADGVWFVAANEAYRIQGEKVERLGAEKGLPTGGNTWMATDGRGQLWFARGSQLGVLVDGQWQKRLTLDASLVRFTPARSGGLWICTATQVLKFNKENQPKKIVNLPERTTVRVMLEDRSGALWIGTGEGGLLRWFENKLEHVSVSHPEISALTEDREGNLWVGTAGGGLNLLRRRAVEIVTTKAGLPFESVRSVCQDHRGELWAALQNGSLAHGNDSQWNTVTPEQGWPGGNATCVVPARDGGVWIGTHGRGLRRLRAGNLSEWSLREGLGSQNVRSLLEATNGDLWVGLESPSGLKRFRNGEFDDLKIPADVRSIRALVEGANGTIWAGTSDGYILRINGTNVVIETGAQDEDEARAFSVRCLMATADGSLWIGYAGWGVGRWHNNQYTRVTAAQGLHDDYVSQMLEDGNGGFWMTGNRGLFQVRREELVAVAEGRSRHLRSIAYGRSEGLPSVQPVFEYSPTAWRANDGQLWFATRNGLLKVQPGKIHDNPVAPSVLLTEVKVDDYLVALHDSHSPLRPPDEAKLADLRSPNLTLELPPGHVKLEFSFTALSFNSPENVHFRYRLKGFDTEWVEAGPQRNAKYPQLPANRYEFEVTACNEAGVWSATGFRLPLLVHPFFWQTWWFQSGMAVAFTAGIIGLVRYFSFRRLHLKLARFEQAEALHRERARIARDMHDEVGSKLSRLSLLSEMVRNQPAMPRAAQSDVVEIAETARDTIRSFEQIVWAVNPKNDSLPQLMNYLCRFAEDFFEGSPTQCVFDLPEVVPDIQLPTEARHHVFLAAKEALNNVFKHAGARQVCVRLTINSNGFEVTIEDDGCGLKASSPTPRAGTGNGLDNIRERMRTVGGESEMTSRPEGGTRIVLRITEARRATD